MKKTVMIVILMAGLFVAGGCTAIDRSPDQRVGNGGSASASGMIPFESFKFSLQGMTRWAQVIEGTRQGDGGLRLEYYFSASSWNNDTGQEREGRKNIHTLKGGVKFYEEIAALLGQYQVQRWNGFVGKNPPGVLDGEMGGFTAILTDGKRISARGSNNFPKGFRQVWQTLRERVSTEPLISQKVETDAYTLTLPAAWIGSVVIRRSIDMIVFESLLEKEKQAILIIHTDSDSYYPEKTGLEAGVLIPADKNKPQLFVTLREGFFRTRLTEAQKAAYAALKVDKRVIAAGIRGRNGYTFVPKE